MGGQEKIAVLGAARKRERDERSDKSRGGFSGVLVQQLALAVSVASESVTVKTEHAYFSSQPGVKALVYF